LKNGFLKKILLEGGHKVMGSMENSLPGGGRISLMGVAINDQG
jgi:hypothetical protein